MAFTPKQRKAALEKGLTVDLASSDEKKYVKPNPTAATKLFAGTTEESTEESSATVVLPVDRLPVALPADPLFRQTVDRQYYRQTVSRKESPFPLQNESVEVPLLPADGLPVVEEDTANKTIPLAPVQWVIWQELNRADVQDEVVSYRKLAQAANASIRGVRDALVAIDKEGGIRSKETIRTPNEQGLRVRLNTEIPFRISTLKETKGLLKRGSTYRQTVDRLSPELPAEGLRMYVYKSSKHTYSTTGRRSTGSKMEELLQILPVSWEIREGTLESITRAFPNMTPLEFRRSLSYLVQQAKGSHQTIQNHNAWIRAAFTKNGGPLVTERMIESQIDRLKQEAKAGQGKVPGEVETSLQVDFEALRRYLTASPQDKEIIDQMSREKAAPVLQMVPQDKHSDILQQALIESARTYFSKGEKPSS
jgi:hypothetical protein